MKRVCVLMDGMSGVAYHRLYVPHYKMALETKLDVVINQRMEEWHQINYHSVDLVVFNRWLGPKQEDILSDLAKMSIPYIVDVDDYWRLHGGHIAKKGYHKIISKGIKQALQYADGITTTTPILESSIRGINQAAPIIQLHNCLDLEEEQWKHKRTQSDKVRIGWVGSVSHLTDVALISGVFTALQKKYDIEVYVCGYNSANPLVAKEWSMIIDYFADKGRPSWLKILEGVNANEYGTLYRHFDIAIAPLQNTKFNHHKSPLKIAEAGAYRLPIVVSAVDPYGLHWDNDGMFMVRNTFEGWYDRLEELIVKPKIREQVGELNKAYCDNVFNLDVENERRLKFYEKCISNIQDHH